MYGVGLRKILRGARVPGLGRTARRRAVRGSSTQAAPRRSGVWGLQEGLLPEKLMSPGVIDGVWVASGSPKSGARLCHLGSTQRGRPRVRTGDCVLYASDMHRLYRLSPDPYSPCTVPTRPLSRQEHMSSTPSLPRGDAAAGQAATAEAFLEEIGLHDVLEQDVMRLLKVCPRPSSLLEALRVLSAQMTRNIEALEGGESKDAAAAETTETLSMIVDTVVRVEAILHNREVGRMPRACCPRASNPAPAIFRTRRPSPNAPKSHPLPSSSSESTPPSRPLPCARPPPPAPPHIPSPRTTSP